jgi:bifunctional UDP-N-acetylglucosamine pyrophosphorylase/glucosamine-1-phosphate N-acetyltransferase
VDGFAFINFLRTVKVSYLLDNINFDTILRATLLFFVSTVFFLLAAGRSSRMGASTSKILFPLGGRRVVDYVIDTIHQSRQSKIYAVVSREVEIYLAKNYPDIVCVRQDEPKGTGDAFQIAFRAAEKDMKMDNISIVVTLGDLPLIQKEDLQPLENACDCDVTVMGMTPPNPSWYGRLVTNGNQVERIVENKEATPEEKEIKICNTGIMQIKGFVARTFLSMMKKRCTTAEYYLTDIVEQANKCLFIHGRWESFLGVNTREELSKAEKILQERWRARATQEGAFLINPESVFFSFDTQTKKDVVIEPFVRFGPGVVIEKNAVIKSFSFLSECTIGEDSTVGPYAHVRQGTKVGKGAIIGSFVETKDAEIGENSQAKHLSYLGNVGIENNVNIGAGTIVCNYDGHTKHKTHIGADTLVGSNSSLIAPLSVGKKVTIGAGSVIGSDVPDETLAVARNKQKNIPLSKHSKHLNRRKKK